MEKNKVEITLTEYGYTLDGKFRLVPLIPTVEMRKAYEANTTGDEKLTLFGYNAAIVASPKPDLSGLQSVKGIHVGGEITEEFEKAGKEMWCKHCGSLIGAESHLPSCPTLKSKL